MRLEIGGGRQLLIGSGPKCDVALTGDGVADRHAYVRGRADGTIELHDLGSETGTYVDGERITMRILRGGERVTIGDAELEIVHEDLLPASAGERGSLPIRTVAAAGAVLALAAVGFALSGVFSGGGEGPATSFRTPESVGLPGLGSLGEVDPGVGVAAVPQLKARSGVETIMQDDATFLYGKSDEEVAASLKKAKELGVDRIRLTAGWSVLAPEADADQRPEFDAADPDAYTRNGWEKYDPIGHWQVLDRAVRLAKEAGLEVMIDVGFWAPKWATSGDPKSERRTFNIDPGLYADFVKSVVRRYNGDYVPKYGVAPPPEQQHSSDSDIVTSVLGSLGGQQQAKASSGAKPAVPKPVGPPLPKVTLWTVWNEPNHLGFIQPQWRRQGSRLVPNSGHIYRSLVHAAYPAIKGIQPDAKILVGATSSTGPRKVRSETDGTPPLAFIRAMACVDAKLRPISSGPCANFQAIPGDGYSHHPYSLLHTPDYSDKRNPDNAGIGDLKRLSKLLDRLAAMRRIDPKVRDLYLTEFGYESNPPDPIKPFSPQEQARFINWSEYLAWKNPRVKAFPQFLLKDMGTVSAEAAARGKREYGDWQSGLFFNDGSPKPAASTFPLALHVDCTTQSKRKLLVIWGHVRPGSGARGVTLEQGRSSFRPAASAASLSKGVVRAASVTPFQTDANGYFLRFAPYKKGAQYRVRADGGGAGLAVPPDTCSGVTKQKRLIKAGRNEF